MSPYIFRTRVLTGLLVALACAEIALGQGHIVGRGALIEKIKGNPAMGYVEVFKTNLFVSPADDSMTGPMRQLGMSRLSLGQCWVMNVGTSEYCLDDLPAGTYSILSSWPGIFSRPKIAHNVQIVDGERIEVNIELDIDYSTYYAPEDRESAPRASLAEEWYQTFVATGIHITGVAFPLGPNTIPSQCDVEILEDTGASNPAMWRSLPPAAGTWPVERGHNPLRELNLDKRFGDNWVRWRSGAMPTTPGKRYAIHLEGHKIGGGSAEIEPLIRHKDENSYVGGRAHNEAGSPMDFDLSMIVFSDNGGTVVPVCRRHEAWGDNVDNYWDENGWGQTWTAMGTSLAAIDVYAVGPNNHWDLEFVWRVRADGPTGLVISPVKRTEGAPYAAGVGLHGVSYNPGDVPLTPGATYFVEFMIIDPQYTPVGFTPAISLGLDDPYDGGRPYKYDAGNWTPYPEDHDISMTVVEYARTGATIELDQHTITHAIAQGSSLPCESFTIWSGTRSQINYSIQDNADWLSVSPTSGTCRYEDDTIEICYNTSHLTCGAYLAEIVVSDPAPDVTNSPQIITVNVTIDTLGPDFDCDGDVDQADFGHLQECYSGAGNRQTDPACADTLLDPDDDVDSQDFTVYQRCFSGASIAADPACEN